tara:strand:- start:238 stop:666 length:429 start_codon:yes stop_codon:yes gene_type:complete
MNRLWYPKDMLKGKSKIKLDNFDQDKVKCSDIYEDKFNDDNLTLSEFILKSESKKRNWLFSQSQLQDLYVLKMNSQRALCPICNGYHTQNDIDFSSDQTCMGVKIEGHFNLFGGNFIIMPSPNQEYAKNIVVNGEVQTKIIK